MVDSRHRYNIGDVVIFRVLKRSKHPGPRAQHVDPEPRGEEYLYEVNKYWVVSGHRPDGTIALQTRRGKEHVVHPDNPRLRPARWWERFFLRHRFPERVDNDAANSLQTRAVRTHS